MRIQYRWPDRSPVEIAVVHQVNAENYRVDRALRIWGRD